MQVYNCKLLQIDAWRDEAGGWVWNNIHQIEDGVMICEDSDILTSPRKAIKYFRDTLGVLSEHSKGRVSIDMGYDLMGGVLLVVCAKGTGEPLFAISSIH